MQSNCNPQTPIKYKQNLIYGSRHIYLNIWETQNYYTKNEHYSFLEIAPIKLYLLVSHSDSMDDLESRPVEDTILKRRNQKNKMEHKMVLLH